MKRRTARSAAGIPAAATPGPVIPAARPAAGCGRHYAVRSQWSGAIHGAVQNLGDAPSDRPQSFAPAGPGLKVTQGWNDGWTTSGADVKAMNLSGNGTLAAHRSATPAPLAGSGRTLPQSPSSQLNAVVRAESRATKSRVAAIGSTAVQTPAVTPPPVLPDGTSPARWGSGNRGEATSAGAIRPCAGHRSAGELAGVKNRDGIWGGPIDAASVTRMRVWRINAVGVRWPEECLSESFGNPVSEDCGTADRNAVKSYIALLLDDRAVLVVELYRNHSRYFGKFSVSAEVAAVGQKPRSAGADLPTFWAGVAAAFQGNGVIDGAGSEIYYPVADSQSLVNTVRPVDVNAILPGGLGYSNHPSQWPGYRPADPPNGLVEAILCGDFNPCTPVSGWGGRFAPYVSSVLGEFGENDCSHTLVDDLMNWGDGLPGDTSIACGQRLKSWLESVSN